jgi:nucleosome binding factor SPN SPT16 subunit
VAVCCWQVVDLVQTLDGGRRNMYDPDEIEEEQREREKRNKINADFNQFVRRVQVRLRLLCKRSKQRLITRCQRALVVQSG